MPVPARLAALVVLPLSLGVAVATPAAAVPQAGTKPAKALVLAQMGPESGPYQPLLAGLRTPVQMAVDEINAAGGVNSTPVQLVTGDEGTEDATVTAATFNRLVETLGAHAIIGPTLSSTAARILTKAKDDNALVCSGSNVASELTTAGPDESGGRYFRTAPPDSLQGVALAELILADGVSRIGVLAPRTAAGADLARSLQKTFRAGGGTIVASTQYDPTTQDVTPAVAGFAGKKLDAVAVLSGVDDGPAAIQALSAANLGPAQTHLYVTSALESDGFGARVDPANPGAAAGIKGTAAAGAPGNVTSPFRAELAKRGVEPFFSAHAYDCTILVALAAEKTHSTDASRLAEAFTSNVHGKNDCNSYAACKALLDAHKTIHWRGASSNFDRFPKNEPRDGVFDVWHVDMSGNPQTESAASQIYVS